MTVDVKIWGIVQGVGFRPFVSRLAAVNGITGWVANEGGHVHIVATGTRDAIVRFLAGLAGENDGPAAVVHMETNYAVEPQTFDCFTIIESSKGKDDLVFLAPDLAICPECERELFTATDRRYLHPFISCMQCGPRYSILDQVPYDRDNTTMVDFKMCSFCAGQYGDFGDRRYHAETISCHDCGPQLLWTGLGGQTERFVALAAAVKALNTGKIVAVKGIGGYHLACTPFCTETVDNLRELKGREAKPFAVMFRNLAEVKKFCQVSVKAAQLLTAREKPIVLLPRKSSAIVASVYKLSRYLGAFLPYTPLHHLLLRETGPLIMTSANISDQPIIKDDAVMLGIKHHHLAGVLFNRRQIRIGIDDSVVRSTGSGEQVIRRARGYAPVPVYLGPVSDRPVMLLATGGQLKNTFCLTKQNFAYLSQHIGELDNVEAIAVYQHNIERMTSLLRIQPEAVCCDLHPDYTTTKFALRYAQAKGVQLFRLQHHFAHIAAVLAEKQIFEPVIGVAFDGTGYGTDGKIWGGEFLLCTPQGFERVAHLQYVPMLGGDAAIKEAWKTACMYLDHAGLEAAIEEEKWPLLKAALLAGVNTISSSSMGRFFDAASAILGLQRVATYEGECAIQLENKAAEYGADRPRGKPYRYQLQAQDGKIIVDVGPCICDLVTAKTAMVPLPVIAYNFHYTVADLTANVCELLREKYRVNRVVLSGGVFQNAILFDLTVDMLQRRNFTVAFNSVVPPNDGGVSLGQAFAGTYLLRGEI
ncbi:MAG: carbamoyltransferase HypF [Heliobacteriaceae bacterium]|nr:carbamoyltransferase HypF [Heliobacteriaceae bacterium]